MQAKTQWKVGWKVRQDILRKVQQNASRIVRQIECTTEREATEEGIGITYATSEKVLDDVDAKYSRTSNDKNEDSQF